VNVVSAQTEGDTGYDYNDAYDDEYNDESGQTYNQLSPFTEASHPLEARVTKDANNHARVFCYMFC